MLRSPRKPAITGYSLRSGSSRTARGSVQHLYDSHFSLRRNRPMTANPTSSQPHSIAEKASWLPLIVVVLTQIQASFAVNALTVSMAGITTDLNTPATSVGTAITAGTFSMAAFILLGAK